MKIQRPIISEKSLKSAAKGWYTFACDTLDRKENIASAIHAKYKVDVLSVRTIAMHGKVRRVGKKAKPTKQEDWKKAIVRLKTGQHIDAFEVVREQLEQATQEVKNAKTK